MFIKLEITEGNIDLNHIIDILGEGTYYLHSCKSIRKDLPTELINRARDLSKERIYDPEKHIARLRSEYNDKEILRVVNNFIDDYKDN